MKYWGGFSEGKLHVRLVDSGFGGWGNSFRLQPAIFKTKAEARLEYEDVRPIEIKEAR